MPIFALSVDNRHIFRLCKKITQRQKLYIHHIAISTYYSTKRQAVDHQLSMGENENQMETDNNLLGQSIVSVSGACQANTCNSPNERI